MSIKFIELEEFLNDIKKLRKYRHLEDDLLVFRKALSVNPTGLSGVEKISEKHRKFKDSIYKAKKFRSRDIPNKGSQSGFRVIFHYDNPKEVITLVEVYHKNQKRDYDRKRLEKHFPIDKQN